MEPRPDALGGMGEAMLVRASERPSGKDEQRAEREEAPVVGPLMGDVFADVVDREDVMVDDTLNDVEQAPADQHPPYECSPAE
jgi:hypothetical protein